MDGHREVEVRRRDRVDRAEDGVQLVGPARVVDGVVHGRFDLGAGGGALQPAHPYRLTGQLIDAGLQRLGESVEDLTAVVGGAALPARQRAAGAGLQPAWSRTDRRSGDGRIERKFGTNTVEVRIARQAPTRECRHVLQAAARDAPAPSRRRRAVAYSAAM